MNCLKKILILGIIALFVGLAFIPSFNAVSISMLDNQPPYVPSNPYPDGPPVDIDVILSWDGGDPDIGDTVTYYVSVDTFPPATVGPYPANQTRIEYDPDGLIYVKEYYWHVVAIDNHGLQTEGPVWSFTTIYPNYPPEAPTVKGKIMVELGKTYDYKFKATDADGDDIRYYIHWDDGYTQWTDYYPSGEEIIVNHTWEVQGTFLVMARANDTHGALGPWGTIQWSKADNEEDCDCQSNGKTHLAEKLLTRLEKNEVLSDVIKSINTDDDKPICVFLEKLCYNLYNFFFKFIDWADKLIEQFPNLEPLFRNIVLSYYAIISGLQMSILILGAAFHCDWEPYYP